MRPVSSMRRQYSYTKKVRTQVAHVSGHMHALGHVAVEPEPTSQSPLACTHPRAIVQSQTQRHSCTTLHDFSSTGIPGARTASSLTMSPKHRFCPHHKDAGPSREFCTSTFGPHTGSGDQPPPIQHNTPSKGTKLPAQRIQALDRRDAPLRSELSRSHTALRGPEGPECGASHSKAARHQQGPQHTRHFIPTSRTETDASIV